MSKNLLFILATAGFLLSPYINFAQSPAAPALGISSSFALFTAAGLVTNNGATTITGDIGTNAETYDGFETVLQPVGARYSPGTITANVATDVQTAYDDLQNRTSNSLLLTPLETNTQPLTPQIYRHGAAATLTGNLILDAENDPNAVFIIQINGEFSTGANTNIILQNGATAANVYWQINGAVSLGINSSFSGTIIAAGAISMAQGAILIGRGLSTGGAINLDNNVITNNSAPLPVTLTSFTVKKGENETALLKWATTAETNSDRFEIEHSTSGKVWASLATVAAKGESNVVAPYEYTDINPQKGTNLYRLKMIDRDATFAYSSIRSLELVISDARTVLFPNPAVDKITLDVDDISLVERIQLNDIFGKVVYDQKKITGTNISANVDMKNLPSGMYVVRIIRTAGATASVRISKQ